MPMMEPGAELGPYISRQPLPPTNSIREWHIEELAHKTTRDSLRTTDAECETLAKELDLTRREKDQYKLSLDELANQYQTSMSDNRRVNEELRASRHETSSVEEELALANRKIKDLKAAHSQEIQNMVGAYNAMCSENTRSLRHHSHTHGMIDMTAEGER